jgi:mono/diheme cytochrome c family protein
MYGQGMIRNLVIGAVALLLVGIVAFAAFGGGGSAEADPSNAQQVALGKQVYAARCASCHGANLEGQANWKQPLANGSMPAPPHDASGHTWHHADALLFAITKNGGQSISPPGYRNGMPAFGGVLSDEEIWAVLAYIKSTWPPDIQATQADISNQRR